ncbi:MAG: PLP-dependent aminotransferase family protein [Myxococcota bacterium]
MASVEWLARITLDRDMPLGDQLVFHVRRGLEAGALKPGDQIPPTRQIARELQVARGTVVSAVETLVAEGLLESRPGAGTFVSADGALVYQPVPEPRPNPPAIERMPPTPDMDSTERFRIDLRPCRPSIDEFPVQAWARCSALAASSAPSPDYDKGRGSETLRALLVDYLRRARGMNVRREQLIVTNGSVHAMYLAARVALTDGDSAVVENPGYPLLRQTLAVAGAQVRPLDVDGEGLRTEELPTDPSRVRIIAVTPSHQFPTGVRMSLRRRHALVQWCLEHGAWVIEDDYDGEFRYDVAPLPPMATMAPERVIYCGTFSKTLFPGIRIGYAVAPEPLIEAMTHYRTLTEYCPPVLGQETLRHFIRLGHYDRHLLRMRRLYAKKRRKVEDVVSRLRPSAVVSGVNSGLSVVVDLVGESADEVLGRGRNVGVGAVKLQRYGSTRRNALIIGYAAPSLEQLEEGLELLFGG